MLYLLTIPHFVLWALAGVFLLIWYVIIYQAWRLSTVFRPKLWRLNFFGTLLFGVTLTIGVIWFAVYIDVARFDDHADALLIIAVVLCGNIVAGVLKACSYFRMRQGFEAMQQRLGLLLDEPERIGKQ